MDSPQNEKPNSEPKLPDYMQPIFALREKVRQRRQKLEAWLARSKEKHPELHQSSPSPSEPSPQEGQ